MESNLINVTQHAPRSRNGSQVRLAALSALFLLLLVAAMPGPVYAERPAAAMSLQPFPDQSLEGWKERSFSGNSVYELTEVDGARVLKGTTNGQASILYKEQTIRLDQTPNVTWTWKVNNVYDEIDEQSRNGDDFPARLYFVVQKGFLPWQTLAITYVWSSNENVGDAWPNPYTHKAKMIAVQSGNSKAGTWVTQTRNIAEDFEEHFGEKITKISGYAVMVDGDNAGKSGTAWFGNISFTP